MKYDILILGNDPIGVEVAFSAAAANLHVGIVLSEDSEVLASTEQLADALSILVPELAVSRICGTGVFAPNNMFNMNDLRSELQGVIDDQRTIAIEQLNARGIDTIHGSARFIDEFNVAVGSTVLTADRFVIATGSRPGATMFTDGDSINNAIQLLQQEAVPGSLAVVGGNRIGMQLGLLFAGIGSSVTIIDGRPLVHCGVETDVLLDRALELGVEFRLGSNMIDADVLRHGLTTSVNLHLESGERMMAERVVMADPVIGNTDTMDLANAGLEADENNRLWCNDELESWQSHIRAIGGVVGFPGHIGAETALQILSNSFESKRMVPRPIGLLRRMSRERMINKSSN